MANEKGIENFVPIAWHASSSDPYYTAEAAGRMSYYGATGFPTCVFDGVMNVVGGSSGTEQQYRDMYDARRAIPAPLTITFLAHSYSGNHASVKVKVKLEENVSEGNVCRIVLWEDNLSYSGKTFHFVERVAPAYEVLTITQKGQEQIISRDFNLDGSWVKANLGVSFMVQKLLLKDVLNARGVKLVEGVGVAPTSLGRVKALYN